MCLSCGCGQPNATHGNPDHITMQDIEKAAKAANTTPEKVIQNIQSGMRQGQSGQTMGGQGSQSGMRQGQQGQQGQRGPS